MRSEDLLRAMSEIDDDLILRSEKKNRISWKPILTMAACLILLLGIGTMGALLWKRTRPLQVALFYSTSRDGGYSYDRAAGEALSAYYGDRSLQYTYYKEEPTALRSQQIAEAVEGGCQLMLLDGRQERTEILTAAQQHPQVTFLAIGVSEQELQQGSLPENILCIDYRPEIAGYLAGYTAVKEGYTKLGYYYDSGLRPYLAYGSGYLQGAEDAAKELGITEQIQVRVSGTIHLRHETQSAEEDRKQIEAWYTEGTQMVLACGALSCEAAEAAARNAKGDVILVGQYQAEEETSDQLSQSIAGILDSILHDSFEQSSVGEMPYYTLNDPDGSWGFRNISEKEFSTLRDSLINGSRPCEEGKLSKEAYSIEILFAQE